MNYAQVTRGNTLIDEYRRIPVKTRLNTWSMCKGVVSCAVGIARAEGLFDIEEKVLDAFPEYAPKGANENLQQLTFRHLLTMTSGLADPLFFADGPDRYVAKDWVAWFFDKGDFRYEPGTKWLYSNFCTFITSAAIERRAGCDLLNYLRYRFFEKIGIGNPDWTLSPKGHCAAANGLYLTIDELTRYGQLIRDKGRFNGVQVVPADYMAEATSCLVDNKNARRADSPWAGRGYGFQFLVNPEPGSYRSDGNYGQWCLAYPEDDLVITVMSLEGNYSRIGALLYEDVVRPLVRA